MQIIDVPDNETFIRRIAEILIDGFTTSGINPWENLESAVVEVKESLAENRISRAAIDEREQALGWIGGSHEYAAAGRPLRFTRAGHRELIGPGF